MNFPRASRYYLLILVLSVLPFIGIFLRPDLPHTSDGGVQIPRMAAYYKALADLHIPVRWAGDLNYGYGMPLFIFIYHTAFIIAAPLIAAGLSLVTSFKILLALSFIGSGLFMFLFGRAFYGNNTKALLLTVLYQFAPYRLVEILVRGSIGGIYAYTFFPLVLYGLTRLTKNISLRAATITAVSSALMIISHNSLALVFFGLSVWWVVLFSPSRKHTLASVLSLLLGLGLSAWFWIPALLEHKYTYGDLFMRELYKVNFPQFSHFFIPNFFDNQALRVSEIAVHIGLLHSVVLLYCLWLVLHVRKLDTFTKKILLYALVPTLFAFVFMHPVTIPIWEHVSWLRQFQFPWRLLAVLTFTTALLGPLLFRHTVLYQRRIIIALFGITVFSTMYYWQPTQGYDRVYEADFWNYPLNTTYFGETDVIWSAGPAQGYPPARIEVIAGTAQISDFSNKTHQQRFTVVADGEARLVSHTQYFPGWRVRLNGQPTPIEFQDQNWRGEITFAVPDGTHQVDIIFGESKIRLMADAITLGSAIILAVLFLYRRKILKKTLHAA